MSEDSPDWRSLPREDRVQLIREALQELHDATPEQVKGLRSAFLEYFSQMPATGLLVEWTPDRPPRCREHGDLAGDPLPKDAGYLMALEHLRDAHGKDGPEMTAVIERAREAIGRDS